MLHSIFLLHFHSSQLFTILSKNNFAIDCHKLIVVNIVEEEMKQQLEEEDRKMKMLLAKRKLEEEENQKKQEGKCDLMLHLLCIFYYKHYLSL